MLVLFRSSRTCASTISTRRGSATGFLDCSTPSTGGELMKRTQRGMTLLSFIIVLAVVGFAAYIGMKLFSMYSEYYSVRQALKGLQAEPGIAKQAPAKIKHLFFCPLTLRYSEKGKPDNINRKSDG